MKNSWMMRMNKAKEIIKENDKNRLINDVVFKLESEGFEVFLDRISTVATIAKNICSNCNYKWHADYNQCIFCGSVNYQLYSCSKCNSLSSITNSGGNKWKCQSDLNCKDAKPMKNCINKNCPTNTSVEIKNIVTHVTNDQGLFSPKKGGLFVSQLWCLNCGNNLDKFISSQIVIKILESNEDLPKINFKIFDNYIFVKDNKFLILNKKNEEVPDNLLYKKNIDINLLYII